VGDSDFLANAYIDLSGNEDFGLSLIHWLTGDERSVIVHKKTVAFKPLLMNASQRSLLLGFVMVMVPGFFLVVGSARIVMRNQTS
jgi:hypothetical protein